MSGAHSLPPRPEVAWVEMGPGVRGVSLVGEVDAANAPLLLDYLQAARADRTPVVLELRGCQFIDSSVIAAILSARRDLASQGLRLGAFGAQGQVRRILEISGLARPVFLSSSREEAIEACQGGVPPVSGGDSVSPQGVVLGGSRTA